MDKKAIKTEAIVGLFVIAAFALLFFMTIKLSGVRKVEGKGYKYFVIFNDVSGLVNKAKVAIAGVNAGYVDKIELTPNGKAKLTIVITKNVKLKKDASAFIKTYGFMGEKYIEIFPGHSKELLANGSFISNSYTEKSIAEVADKISVAVDEFRNFFKSLNNSIGGKKGEEKIVTILDNFEKISSDLSTIISQNKNKFQNIVNNIDLFSKNISSSSENFNKIFLKVDKTFSNLALISDKIAKGKGSLGKLINDDTLYNNVNNVFAKISQGKGTLGKLIYNDSVYDNLQTTLANLKNITDKIKQGKGTFGKLINNDKVYNDLKITLANLKSITDNIKAGKGTIGKMVNDDKMYKEIDKTLLRIQQAASGFSEQTPISTFGVVMGTLFSF